MAAGTPCSGPRAAPVARAASAARALSRACPKSRWTKALRLGLRRSMRSMVEVISSTGDSSCWRMRRASSAADDQAVSSVMSLVYGGLMRGSSLSEVGAAVIGTGFIGTVHVEALRRLGVQVHGVVGSSSARAAERARVAALPPAYESMDAMLADKRVDVVHVTSPNHLHHPHAKAALSAGKHVVCEKPLAMTSAESAELLRLAESSGLVHATNFNIRFYPLLQHVHQMVG